LYHYYNAEIMYQRFVGKRRTLLLYWNRCSKGHKKVL